MLNYHIPLHYRRPPLTANMRLHWAKKAEITKEIRTTTTWLAKAHRLPRDLQHCTVTLHYAPVDKRRRDADNLVPTLKAICDGLVDYGLVPDDTPQFMTKHMPIIEQPERPARTWLTITEGD